MGASLDAAALDAWARRTGLPWRLECYDVLSSSNLLVKEAMAQGRAEGYGAACLKQEAGYGRQGRPWVSPVGGLYFSVLLRPNVSPQRLMSIGPALSFAVREALAGLVAHPDEVLIKWPNDVVCARGKLCGMSCEHEQGAVCIGIGINIFRPARAVQVGGKNQPAYLIDLMTESNAPSPVAPDSDYALPYLPELSSLLAPGSIERIAPDEGMTSGQVQIAQYVLQAVLFALDRVYRRWLEQGFSALRADYCAHAALLGSFVRVVTITDSVIAAGTVEGIDSTGCLLLRPDSGDLMQVASGEIHLR